MENVKNCKRMWREVEEYITQHPYHRQYIDDMLQKEMNKADLKIVVLDDDPTGVQTVHDVVVYTDWTLESIEDGFKRSDKLFFILTNSRGMTEEETSKVHHEIGKRICEVAKKLDQEFLLISRSDSTLRGHFPLETEILKEELEQRNMIVDGEILIPFFQAGGRYTMDDVHYVRYGEEMVPAADTEFARDKTFGYQHSELPEYIEEKTKGKYPAESASGISLVEERGLQIAEMTKKLEAVTDFEKIYVNAIEPEDVKVFCIALYRAIQSGKHFIFRTAADFVKAVAGVSDKPLLRKEELLGNEEQLEKEQLPDKKGLPGKSETSGKIPHGGIIVIGSHTAKTTAQLEYARIHLDLVEIPFQSDLVLEDRLDEEVKRVNQLCDRYLSEGKTVITYTSRTLLSLPDDTKEQALVRSVKISDSVQKLVANLAVKPSFVIAKGGITSYDVGVKALNVKKAYVLGQILPGIPVWKTDEESRFPGIPYIIFPGNVGDEDSLMKAIEKME